GVPLPPKSATWTGPSRSTRRERIGRSMPDRPARPKRNSQFTLGRPWTRPVHEARVARMTQTSPPSSVLELLIGKWGAQAVSAAAELRIADELKDGPRPCAEIARAVGASEDALYRL